MPATSKGQESQKKKRERARKIESRLRKGYSTPTIALKYSTPLQLLISVILSAQCTDARVNMVTPALFRKYRIAKDFAAAVPAELEREIHSTGFYRNKAKNIIACCKALLSGFDGEVPSTMEELIQLPGVGRKTANCVLGGAFGIAAGVVVDTHVIRLSNRLGLTTNSNAEKIEEDLCRLIDQEDWIHFGNAVILHGRKICSARNPLCNECIVNDLCPSANVRKKEIR